MIIQYLKGNLAIWQVETRQPCFYCKKVHPREERILIQTDRPTGMIEAAFCDKRCMALYVLNGRCERKDE